MATFIKFNAFVANLAAGGLNLNSDALKIMLTNTLPTWATNSVYADISGTEIASGTGYTTGGLTIATTSSSQTAGAYSLVLANSALLTATGTVGPFRYAVLYDTAGSGYLIGGWDYGANLTLSTGDTFQVLSPGTVVSLT